MESYAYRLETIRIAEPEFKYAGQTLNSPKDAASFARSLTNYDQEKQLSIFLNTKNTLVGISIQTGTINQSPVYPREIVKRALLSAAVAVLLVHNHPSGNVTPSPEDISITQEVKKACDLVGVRVLDHVIIGDNGSFHSLREAGHLR